LSGCHLAAVLSACRIGLRNREAASAASSNDFRASASSLVILFAKCCRRRVFHDVSFRKKRAIRRAARPPLFCAPLRSAFRLARPSLRASRIASPTCSSGRPADATSAIVRGTEVTGRPSRIVISEKSIDLVCCRIPGRLRDADRGTVTWTPPGIMPERSYTASALSCDMTDFGPHLSHATKRSSRAEAGNWTSRYTPRLTRRKRPLRAFVHSTCREKPAAAACFAVK